VTLIVSVSKTGKAII